MKVYVVTIKNAPYDKSSCYIAAISHSPKSQYFTLDLHRAKLFANADEAKEWADEWQAQTKVLKYVLTKAD